jgi:hypothetical protein
MLYKPGKVRSMWDTWLYYHDGTHYLYYLHKSTGKRWDGMSVATSKDGVHYEEVGPIIQKRDDAEWLGTGSVWRAGEEYILNFSESRNGVQAVFFARSSDLLNWERLDDEFRCDPDPKWYDDTKTGRWDCIWALPNPGGGFWGYLTARPWNKTRGMKTESVGKVESEDGVKWHAVAPPAIEWGDWPQMNVGEVGAIEKIGDKYYMMLGYGESGLGGRQVLASPTGGGTMYTFVGDSPEGPFTADHDAYRLLASNGTYFSRFYPSPDGMLVNHHSIEKDDEGRLIWMAPLKKAVVDDGGHLRLGYWPGNEAVKGKEIAIDLTTATAVYPTADRGQWKITPDRFAAEEYSRGGILMLDSVFDTESGIVLEASVEVKATPRGWGGAGIYIELNAEGHSGTGFMLQTRGCTEIGAMSEKGNFNPDYKADSGITPVRMVLLRIFLRRTMVEIYLDDLLVQCYSFQEIPTGRLGLTFESCEAVFENVKAWEMNL